MIWCERCSITLPLWWWSRYRKSSQKDGGIFIVHGDLRLPNGSRDWFMVVSRTCNLKALKLGPFYFELNFSEPKWRMGWEYIQLFRELGWISSAIGLISSGRGEIWWNLTQQSATFITPNLPVSGVSWVFYRNVFGPNICGDVDDFLPAQRQGVRISCLHWRR